MKKNNVLLFLNILFQSKWLSKAIIGVSFCLVTMCTYAGNNPGYVILQNGVQFQTEHGPMRVEFVSPEIVRVQYTKETDFLGNGTIVCVERSKKNTIPD